MLTANLPARSMRGHVRRRLRDAEQHERRVERHRRERVGGHADRLVAVHRGDDRDAGGEVTEHVAERVDRRASTISSTGSLRPSWLVCCRDVDGEPSAAAITVGPVRARPTGRGRRAGSRRSRRRRATGSGGTARARGPRLRGRRAPRTRSVQWPQCALELVLLGGVLRVVDQAGRRRRTARAPPRARSRRGRRCVPGPWSERYATDTPSTSTRNPSVGIGVADPARPHLGPVDREVVVADVAGTRPRPAAGRAGSGSTAGSSRR